LKVLTELFAHEEDAMLADIDKVIFSNLCSPNKFPNAFGSLDESVSLLISFTSTPDDAELLEVLHLFVNMLKHKWACKAFFQNA